MKRLIAGHTLVWLCAFTLVLALTRLPAHAGGWTLVGWNNLGMHCMDSDYSVSALLPPYNTIHAQLIDPQGRLVHDPTAITVTYEAIADPDGSINSTSAGKTNFWEHVESLFGVTLAPDVGLKGLAMPGATNQPQPMSFDSAASWFIAEGIPITPYDDAHRKNTYPLMHLVARDGSGTALAATDIVLPVSDEMNCQACHASGTTPGAQPRDGWVFDANPERDVRLNILRLHDDRDASDPVFESALAAVGYNPAGLYATVTTDGKSILCATCHASAALAASGQPGIEPLTLAVHRRMANVFDPVSGGLLDATTNRSACYRCHPGSTTRCLRGAMGAVVAPDGALAMQCQSCHGSMMDVASATRSGWLDEPACQQCHTGTATHNNGQIRYTSVFDAPAQARAAIDQTFATNADAPAAGLSLYRFSTGHGGLACEACHGPTHAEFPSTQRNDNIQSIQHQGHVGAFAECASCHGTQPSTISGGPHGMHPVGQAWVNRHGDAVGDDGNGNAGQCQACHGADYRGTVLSRAQADRVLNTEDFGSKSFWRGFQIGCYTCHLGPSGEGRNRNRPAAANDAAASTTADTPVTIPLQATDPDGNALDLRIVSQPSNGTVGLDGTLATYLPESGFAGADSFTFAAWDGSTDSNLATVSITVSAPLPTATAPPTWTLPALVSGTVPCGGDCNGDQQVTVDELLILVDLALGNGSVTACDAGDANHDGQITIDEIVTAVSSALAGCPATSSTPTPTPSATPTTASALPTPTFSLASTFPQIEATIFATSCLNIGCHNAADQAGGQVLAPGEAYAALVNVPPVNVAAAAAGLLRVVPGDPDRSFLLTKLTMPSAFDPQLSSRMPLGLPLLPAAQIEPIRAWILRGALPNE